MNTDLINRAIAFFNTAPTGQYDEEAVEALEALCEAPKLYIWDGVLQDWTSGIAFAIATSPEAARDAIVAEYVAREGGEGATAEVQARCAAIMREELAGEPRIAQAGFCHGGA